MRTDVRKRKLVFGVAIFAVMCDATLAHAANEGEPNLGAPDDALWTGVRAGVFVPYGGLFTARNLVTTEFHDVAVGGPEVEIDLGARIGRRWVTYGFSQLVSLGRGKQAAWTTAHGGETSASSQAIGIAFRWIARPDGLGAILDLGIGYRRLVVSWNDGTTLDLQNWGEARLGFGTNFRIGEIEICPTLMLYAGGFRDRTFAGQPIGDSSSSYTAIGLDIGGHFDLFGVRDR